MASIDAFWDLASREPASKPALRLSLRRLTPRASETTDQRVIDRRPKRQNTLILIGIALLHVLMLLGLRAAMQPSQTSRTRTRDATPLQITFIERQPLLVVPKPIVAPPVVSHPRVTPTPQRFVSRTDALQAVTIVPRIVPVPMVAELPKMLVYGGDGELLVPPAPVASSPRDLLADHPVTQFLPGSAHQTRADFHVNTDSKAKRAVETIGALFGGGRFDPCANIKPAMVDVYDAKSWAEADDRHQRLCEGH